MVRKSLRSIVKIIVSSIFYLMIVLRPLFIRFGKYLGGFLIATFFSLIVEKIILFDFYWAVIFIDGLAGLNILLLAEFYDDILRKIHSTGLVINT